MSDELQLSRREREIMDVIYRRERATANEVMEGMEAPPTNAAIRRLLAILEEKGHLKHVKVGKQFVYIPTQSRTRASHSMLKKVVDIFFGGSSEKTIAAVLDVADTQLTDVELDRLRKLIQKGKERGERDGSGQK